MTDHFERLGLPRRFSVDAAELDRAYHAASRAVHPDFHGGGTTADQSASLEWSAALNEAYATLKDPFRRAEHLLALEGGPAATDGRQMPQAFLAEMLDARERVEETRGGGTRDESAVSALEAEFAVRYDAILGEVADRLAAAADLPAGTAERATALSEVRGLLNAAKYVRGLLRDLHAD